MNPHNYIVNDSALQRNESETQWLREQGLPAVGLKRQIELYDEWVNNVEQHVLSALDEVAQSVNPIAPGSKGWFDRELPILLPAIRKHAETMWEDRIGSEILKLECERIANFKVLASFPGKNLSEYPLATRNKP